MVFVEGFNTTSISKGIFKVKSTKFVDVKLKLTARVCLNCILFPTITPSLNLSLFDATEPELTTVTAIVAASVSNAAVKSVPILDMMFVIVVVSFVAKSKLNFVNSLLNKMFG